VDYTWFKDVTKITEKDIEALGPDYFDLVMWGSPCEDFSKLRLLPNRPGQKSRRRKKGVDPRPGLMCKHGRLLLVCCQVFKWVLKYGTCANETKSGRSVYQDPYRSRVHPSPECDDGATTLVTRAASELAILEMAFAALLRHSPHRRYLAARSLPTRDRPR